MKDRAGTFNRAEHKDGDWSRPSLLKSWSLYRRRFAQYAFATGASASDTRAAWTELQNDPAFLGAILERVSATTGEKLMELGASVQAPTRLERFLTMGRFSLVNAELYSLVRCAKPEKVVETGVASGVSSTIILQALSKNQKGRLVSIDLPNYARTGVVNADGVTDYTSLEPGYSPGWVIPSSLRERWTLLLGDSRAVLPGTLGELGSIDFFFHDSEHSVEVMSFEFGRAWRALRLGGILYSDDIFWNRAFPDFAASMGKSPQDAVTAGHRGLLIKKDNLC